MRSREGRWALLGFALLVYVVIVHCDPIVDNQWLGSEDGVTWVMARESEVSADGTTLTNATLWESIRFEKPILRPTNDSSDACRWDGAQEHLGWIESAVPGTVLGSMVAAGVQPDPYYSMNNELIPDLYHVGAEYYTFWFYANLTLAREPDTTYWLNLRGINYEADVYINGRRAINDTLVGMFKIHKIDVTGLMRPAGMEQQIALLVTPPFPPGNATVGQCGDGTIAKSVTCQYMAGWDWITATRDRSTGPWDKVGIQTTGPVVLLHPRVLTSVPGVRSPATTADDEADAEISPSITIQNASPEALDVNVCWFLTYGGEGKGDMCQAAHVLAYSKTEVTFANFTVTNPRLWWPTGLGDHPLYDLEWRVLTEEAVLSDRLRHKVGLREVTSDIDVSLDGRRFWVNGNKVFVRGANWIGLDAMMRMDKGKGRSWYEDEVRMHAEMNFNMIRVWGGGVTERPEFYDACDRYGLLVWQEFWMTGDWWPDPLKRESPARRRAYPNMHSVFLESAEDAIKMLRTHPSLVMWVGGNEWPPPPDVDVQLAHLVNSLDPGRLYMPSSESRGIGTNGDGPYGIQDPRWYFSFHDPSAFNPEMGSVGLPTAATMKETFTAEELRPFGITNPAWLYHKFKPYGTDSAGDYRNGTLPDQIGAYGVPHTIEEYCSTAQVVNYVQYRALLEARNSRMWSWYTGILVWKSQNPWLGLRGQFYDWLGEQVGGYYGAKLALEENHIQLNLNTSMVEVVNHSLLPFGPGRAQATTYLLTEDGSRVANVTQSCNEELPPMNANTVISVCQLPSNSSGVYFLELLLRDETDTRVARNVYWLTPLGDAGVTSLEGRAFEVMQNVQEPSLNATVTSVESDGETVTATVRVRNNDDAAQGRIAFFLRLQVLMDDSLKRVLPVYYTDNYVTLMAGQEENVTLTFRQPSSAYRIILSGWNVAATSLSLPQ